MFVKVCGLTREADVEAALAAGADAVGFVLADSSRQVTLARARELAAMAGGRAMTVAVVVDRDDLSDLEGFDAVQVHGAVPPRPAGLKLLRAIASADEAGPADWLLLDGSRGTGAVARWAELADRDWPAPFILAGGLSPENVGEAVRVARPFGVDVSSGVETAPGVKDATLIKAFIDAAKAAR